jgi:hypothetical protein
MQVMYDLKWTHSLLCELAVSLIQIPTKYTKKKAEIQNALELLQGSSTLLFKKENK